MEVEVININQGELLTAQTRAEVDIQISTAKAYPRDITLALDTIKTLATMDESTAEECFYVLRRGNSDANKIEGVSVRLAEIIATAWGNLRVQTRIIGNDGKTITAQGICHDLQTNVAVSVEVKRRITDKQGRTYSEDMQVVTGNAASAIAFRNAVLKVIPGAVTKKVIDEIRNVGQGKALTIETRLQRCISNFAKINVSEQQLLSYCGIASFKEITSDLLDDLSGTWTAIKEGTTTVQETFELAAKQASAKEQAKTIQSRVAKAMAKEAAPANETQLFDPETGEIK